MHNYPQIAIFLDHNLKLHKMIEMHSKYDNMHTNRIFNALNRITNNINMTRRDREVIVFTRSRVKNNTEFTNLMI